MALIGSLEKFAFGMIAAVVLATPARPQAIEFTADRWDLTNARIVEHLGRQAMTGTALLKDVQFENGVI